MSKTIAVLALLFCFNVCHAQKRYDTVKVIMLCNDTSNTGIVYYIPNIGKTKGTPYSFWAYGYKVTAFIGNKWDIGDILIPEHYELIDYLDKYKKPLNTSIVVWYSKECSIIHVDMDYGTVGDIDEANKTVYGSRTKFLEYFKVGDNITITESGKVILEKDNPNLPRITRIINNTTLIVDTFYNHKNNK